MRLYGFIYVDEFYPDRTPEIVIASHDEETEVIVNRIIQEFELDESNIAIISDMVEDTLNCGEGIWTIDSEKDRTIIAKVLYIDNFKDYLRRF